jgi:hypothetical protein
LGFFLWAILVVLVYLWASYTFFLFLNKNLSYKKKKSKIREHVLLFNNRLFIEQFSWRPKLDDLAFDSIDEEEGPLG